MPSTRKAKKSAFAFTTTTTTIDYAQLKGQRCRVFYTTGGDFFGRKDDPKCKGWFLGTILGTAEPLKDEFEVDCLKVRFDDQTEGVVEVDEAQRLVPGETPDTRHLWYAQNILDNDGSLSKIAVADTCPSALQTGDLVLGLYQAGAEKGAWFRGRVAATRQEGTVHVCDIAYDDGDCEKSVPYSVGNYVTLLEKGEQYPSWLVGLTVPLKSRKAKIPTGVVFKAAARNAVVVEYTTTSGELFSEKRHYHTVVSALFSNIHTYEHYREVDWPHPASTAKPPRSARSVNKENSRNSTASSTVASEKNNEALQPLGRRSSREPKKTKQPHSHEDDDDEDFMEEARAPKEQAKTRKKRKQKENFGQKSKRLKGKKTTMQRTKRAPSSHKVPAVVLPSPPSMPPATAPEDVSFMHDSLGDHFIKALDSPDPELGESLLSFVTSFHGQVPSLTYLKTLTNILLYGPKHHGTIFPDCHRLNVAFQYFLQVLPLAGHVLDLDWQVGWEQMTAPHYTLPGDESRTSAAARKRLGLTLHARAVCMESLQRLLRQQIRAADYRSQPLLSSILGHSRGPKEALEVAAKGYVSAWSRYGKFAVGEFSMDGDDLVVPQTVRLLSCMGKVLSDLAVLYSNETHEDMTAVADMIGTIAQREFEKMDDNIDMMNSRIKLNFIMKLDVQVVPQIFSKLADRLEVAEMFNVIYGD